MPWKEDKVPFKPREEGEEVLGQEYTYLIDFGALMYLANNTRADIAFTMKCLARHSVTPTICHWSDINNILRCLIGTIDLGLYFQKKTKTLN
jgi:hypothetical protein